RAASASAMSKYRILAIVKRRRPPSTRTAQATAARSLGDIPPIVTVGHPGAPGKTCAPELWGGEAAARLPVRATARARACGRAAFRVILGQRTVKGLALEAPRLHRLEHPLSEPAPGSCPPAPGRSRTTCHPPQPRIAPRPRPTPKVLESELCLLRSSRPK